MSEEIIIGGVHGYGGARTYCPPKDPLVRERLEWWQDQKLGFMVHWGPYSQWGAIESWALSDEDSTWSREGLDEFECADDLKHKYWALNRTFNPTRFRPDDWARAALEGGFKYFVFTTKHHDGFAMYDTALSDYKVTAPDCPFHTDKRANITKELFDAFRAQGIEIAAYFSKADWHSPYYWEPGMPQGLPSRNPNYDTKARPDKWEKFVEFTQGQILELMAGYGPVRMLWLDAGWVRPDPGYWQDIRMPELAAKCRALQPGLIVVDRTVAGPQEDYLTPEQTIPPEPLLVPWEACITMGDCFSFRFDENYKSLRAIIHTLIDVVAKGGNLALNVGAQPDGRLPGEALRRMKQIGLWMDAHGEAIYGTRAAAPYRTGDFAFTGKGCHVYCFRLYDEESGMRDSECLIPYPGDVKSVELMGCGTLRFTREEGEIRVRLPWQEGPAPIADVYKLTLG